MTNIQYSHAESLHISNIDFLIYLKFIRHIVPLCSLICPTTVGWLRPYWHPRISENNPAIYCTVTNQT